MDTDSEKEEGNIAKDEIEEGTKKEEVKSERISELLELSKKEPEETGRLLHTLRPKMGEISKENINIFLCVFYGREDIEEARGELMGISYQSAVCSKNINKIDIFWVCTECSRIGDCSCYCMDCYEKERHIGHDTYWWIGNVGCCDCGDITALDPVSFCTSHRLNTTSDNSSSTHLLPPYIQAAGPLVINHLGLEIFHAGQGGGQAPTQGGQTPTQWSDLQNNMNESVRLGLLALADLFLANKLIIPWLSSSLLQKVPGYLTQLPCTPNPQQPIPLTDTHQCTCTILDTVMRHLLQFIYEPKIFEMFAEMAKQYEPFRSAFYLSFFANYDTIMANSALREKKFDEFDKILWQIIVTPDDPTPLISNSLYFDQYIRMFRKYITEFIEAEEDSQSLKTKIYHLYYDFHYFIIKGEINVLNILENTKFLECYTEMMSRCQFKNAVEPRETHIMYAAEGLKPNFFLASHFCTEMFARFIHKYDFSNPQLTKKLAQHLRYGLEKSFEYSNIPPSTNRYILIPLNRCLGMFLIKLIGTRFTFIPKRPSFLKLKTFLKMFFNFDTEKDMQIFFSKVLETTFRVLQFVGEIAVGKWIYYGEDNVRNILRLYRERNSFGFNKEDLALIQLIMPLCDTDTCPVAYCSLIESSNIEAMAIKTKEEKIKEQKFLEEKLFTLCGIISNDTYYPEIYLKNKIEGFGKDTNESEQPHLRHILSRLITTELLPSGPVQCQFFNMTDVINQITYFLRTNEIESEFRKYSAPKLNKSEKRGYTLKSEALGKCNIWNCIDPNKALNAEMTAKELMKEFKCGAEVNLLSPKNGILQLELLQKEIKLKLLSQGILPSLVKIFNSEDDFLSTDGLKLFSLKLIYEIIMLTGEAEFKEEATMYIKEKHPISTSEKEMLVSKLHEFGKENEIYSRSIKDIISRISDGEEMWDVEKEGKGEKIEEAKARGKAMQEKALAQMVEMRKKFEGSTGIEEERKEEESGEERPLCSYCKEELEMDKYEDSPYGKIGIMSGSQLYSKAMSYTLRQLCTFYAISPHEEDMKELKLDLYPPYIAPIDLDSQFYLCGHYLHYHCLKKYRGTGENRNLYLCPLCKSAANTLLPILNQPPKGTTTPILEEYLKSIMMEISSFNILKNDHLPPQSPANFSVTKNSKKLIQNMLQVQISHFQYIDILGLEEFYKHEYHLILSSQLNLLLRHIGCMSEKEAEGEEAVPKIDEGLAYINTIWTAQKQFKLSITNSKTSIHTILALILPILVEYAETREKNTAICATEEFISLLSEGVTNTIIQTALRLWLVKHNHNPQMSHDLLSELLYEINDNKEEIMEVVFRQLDKCLALVSVVEQWSQGKIKEQISRTRGNNLTHQELFDVYKDILSLKTDFFTDLSEKLSSPEGYSMIVKETLATMFNQFEQGKNYILAKKYSYEKEKIRTILAIHYYLYTSKLSFDFISINREFDEFMLTNYPRSCKHCKKSMPQKCICLLCGCILCLNSDCCRFNIGPMTIGEITYHSITCAGGNGYFLLVKEGALIVQGVGKGMLTDAPFTNEYGDSLSTFFKHVFPPHKSKDFKSYYLNEAKINDLRDAFLYGKTKQIIEYALIKGSLAINSPFI